MGDIEDREFIRDLVRVLVGSIDGVKTSIDVLIELENRCGGRESSVYGMFRSLIDGSRHIDDIVSGMDPDAQDTVLLIFMKVSAVSRKLDKLFDLTLSEKRQLQTDMERLSEFMRLKADEYGDRVD